MRLTIDEYSQQFKMSKEMINSKLRAKKLNYIIEDNKTYIIVANKAKTPESINSTNTQEPQEPKVEAKKEATVKTKAVSKPKTTVATILALYQRENQQLKAKIIQLEEKIDKLIDDKEQMLRDEMQKIEQVYSAKDEQLKNILELVNAKLMLESTNQTVHEVETLQTQKNIENVEDVEKNGDSKLIELRAYLKTLKLKSYQRKVIRKRFLAVYDSDVRIIQQNGKLYLDFSKYDYSDLLEY
ncbi:hypothetical protein [Sulfurimonas sp.]